MRNRFLKSFLFFLAISIGIFIPYNRTDYKWEREFESDEIHSTSSPEASIEQKKERAEYFFRMLKDPVTNKIPERIREKELAFAKKLKESHSLNKTENTTALNWKEAGPRDVGGRTRALAVDINNSNIILAGGVSGGIWKSTDKGATWSMKSSTSQILSVTCIAQDIRSGHTSTWYYASGEFDGSCSDLGFTAWFTGGGVYKSTDNGETWSLLPNAKDNNIAQWNTPYDYVSDIKVNPATGSVFLASNGFGILRSTDEGNSFSVVLGGPSEHIYSDIDIASNGNIVVVVSSPFGNTTPTKQPGIYKSTDDGNTWTNITPSSFPSTHYRSEIEIAPSNTDVCYVITFTGNFIDDKYDDIRFYKINILSGNAEDRTANLPNFGYDFDDFIKTQNNYNLVMAIKPDDENFVVLGATSLFRSTNGFSTKPNDPKLDWIGGYSYSDEAFMYPNFHPDIHSFAFDPNNPNAVWWGHDGGLSYTSDIRNTNYSTFFPWENKNNGYNVTQFYMVAMPDEANDPRIMGGTQDNGTPAFKFDGSTISKSFDVSSGDGAYAYFGNNYPYVSSQNGLVLRAKYDPNGNPVRQYPNYSNITPIDAKGQLFINPFVIDPNNENIMIYPAGNTLWRNNQLNSLPDNPDFSKGLSQGWSQLNGAAPDGYVITAMAMSINSPSSRLYYAAVDFSQNGNAPKLYRLDNAQTSTNVVDISINGLQSGMYIHNIAVNPDNGNEILVIISNYNVMGIYYSNNGGTSFTGVEGNLEGTQNNPGPSIRGASILPYNGTTKYFVGTSIGVYSTTNLNGSSTVWEQEGTDVIGNLIVNYITSRPSDGRVVAGSHGRGAFVSDGSGTSSAPKPVTDVQSLTLHARPGETGSTSFVLGNDGGSTLSFNITVSGDLMTAIPQSNRQVLKRKDTDSQITRAERFKRIAPKYNGKINGVKSDRNSLSKSPELLGNDILIMDDGDDGADYFLGWDDGSDFYWNNDFTLSGFDFSLDEIDFFMRTESATSNDVYVAVYDQTGTTLIEGTVSFNTSTSGDWYAISINPALNFSDGEMFSIVLGTQSSFIQYPAGIDFDASVPNNSYYYNGISWVNINTMSGFENAAFLIRAVGTIGGGGTNQNPVAIANVTPTQANVNDPISFDASGSYDNDGQITQYLWEFGDGATSNQATVQHSYNQANTYTYTLTVTDDKGATNRASGQVVISQTSSSKVTVNPSNGTISPGSSQTITLTLDASTVSEGNYVGQVNISTNGGNIVIPIDYAVKVEKVEGLPREYSLSQNYPNPFNPSTTIEFAIPQSDDVSLIVYDMLGREVAELVNDKLSAGNYKVQYNAAEKLSSGVYIYRIKTNNFNSTKKLLLLK